MTIPSLSLAGQVAIVTGARRGIGRDTALVLAGAGADIAICDLVTETGELEAVAAEIRALGRRVITGQSDAASTADMTAFVRRVADEFGTVDILVNNAGIPAGSGPPEPANFAADQKRVMELLPKLAENPVISLWDERDWDRVVGANMKSVLVGTQAVAPFMTKNRRGTIVNVSSVLAYARGGEALSAYAVSKRGIAMLTEGLAADLGRFGIRVNAIAPGAIETEMMRGFWSQPETLKYMESKVLLGNKMLQPRHCAHLVLFLASELSRYITGQTIAIDGGFTLAPRM